MIVITYQKKVLRMIDRLRRMEYLLVENYLNEKNACGRIQYGLIDSHWNQIF